MCNDVGHVKVFFARSENRVPLCKVVSTYEAEGLMKSKKHEMQLQCDSCWAFVIIENS